MSSPTLTQLHSLLADWRTIRDALRADADRDRAEGLSRAPEAAEVAIAAMNGCIDSLEAILPDDA